MHEHLYDKHLYYKHLPMLLIQTGHKNDCNF